MNHFQRHKETIAQGWENYRSHRAKRWLAREQARVARNFSRAAATPEPDFLTTTMSGPWVLTLAYVLVTAGAFLLLFTFLP